jgi:HAD superfamily hydrolase (TIGR01662 family)
VISAVLFDLDDTLFPHETWVDEAARIAPYEGVREGLTHLSALVPVGIVTDGDPRIQRAKLHALDLRVKLFVCSDEMSHEFRKPHVFPFKRAAVVLRVRASDCVFVGDDPGRDIAGAADAGMRTVRVGTGAYANVPDEVAPWRRAPSAADAMQMLIRRIRETADTSNERRTQSL